MPSDIIAKVGDTKHLKLKLICIRNSSFVLSSYESEMIMCKVILTAFERLYHWTVHYAVLHIAIHHNHCLVFLETTILFPLRPYFLSNQAKFHSFKEA